VILKPACFLIIAMHDIPRRPAAVVIAGVADELCVHVLLAERGARK
jgi:hypothetical protein